MFFRRSLGSSMVLHVLEPSGQLEKLRGTVFLSCDALAFANMPEHLASRFVANWRILNDKTLTLPFSVPVTVTVNWGDNSVDEFFNNTNLVTHSYSSSGTFAVYIVNEFEGFRFNGMPEAEKLINITGWGDFVVDENSTNMFSGCVNLLFVPSLPQPIFRPGATLAGMFRNTNFSSPLSWDLTNVTSMDSMFFDAWRFNETLDFTNTQGITSMASMFRRAKQFNQPIMWDTSGVTDVSYMFAETEAFNQPFNFSTRNWTAADGMYFQSSAFDQKVTFSGLNLRSTAFMFAGTTSFNGPVTITDGFFLNNVTGMFEDAIAFNQPVSLRNTAMLQSLDLMFAGAVQFNQPFSVKAGSSASARYMFANATAFNSVVNITTSDRFELAGMFAGATSFNQPVTFTPAAPRSLERMFAGATSFNQPIVLDTTQVGSMAYMFDGATSFNQPITFATSSVLTSVQRMFSGASSFNQPVSFSNTNSIVTMEGMFADAIAFNQTVSFATPNVTNMAFMFSNVLGFQQNFQNFRSWNAASVVNCSNFCHWCGLPSFSLCSPCPNPPISSRTRGDVCNCPTGDVCGSGLCSLAQVSAQLTVECNASGPIVSGPGVSPTPTRTVISPLFHITQEDGNATSFVFTLPIYPQAYVALGRVSQACSEDKLSCEWQDPNTLEFQRSGCAVSQENVDMGSGVRGTQCTCTHLTVFAIVLRSEMQLAPFCQAQEIDYVLLALYAALAALIIVQMIRLWCYFLSRVYAAQHCLLLLACGLRMTYLIIKPIVHSLAGLVTLGLVPSAISLCLFINLLVTWASVRMFARNASDPSAFTKCQVPFLAATACVCAVVLVIAILVAVAVGDSDTQVRVVTYGSYVLAALYAVVCVCVLVAGACVRRAFAPEKEPVPSTGSIPPADWKVLRSRVLVAMMGLSACLFAVACLWVAAVQMDIIVSSAATLATSAGFYVCDWLSLCVMMWVLSKAVRDVLRKQQEFHRESLTLSERVDSGVVVENQERVYDRY